jgi:ankyrin repeat protein
MEEERDVELLRKEIHDLQQQLARLEGHRSPMQRLGSQMRTIYESKFGNGSSNRVELDNAIDSMDNIPPQYTTDMSIQGTPRSLLDSHEYFSPTKSRKGRPAGEVSDCSTPEALPSNDNEYRKVGENDQNSRQADPVLELHEAVLIGELQRVRELLRQSYDSQRLANECTLTGMSPLHLAVKTGRLHLVKTLLEFGAAANCQDPNGNTPLHISPSSEITALLLEVGRANPNMPDAEGRCALHYAVRRLDIASVQHFVRFKLEVNMADNTDWQTPLHWAARMLVPQSVAQARAKIADLLCSASADVNAQDKDGNTALHHTVILESQEACDVLEILLNAKADPNIMNAKQQTPLHLLLHNDGLRNLGVLQEMLHNLLHFGANPNLWTRTGCTPLHLCLYHRDVDSAVQLASRGAELHLSVWKKPQRWEWDGGTELLAIDMVSDNHDLHRILAAISKPQKWAPNRPWCMHCKEMLGSFARAMHCRHCGRFVCGGCLVRALPPTYFPKSFEIYEQAWVCVVCEEILVSRRQGGGDDDASVTQPTTSLLDENASRASF